MDGNVELRDRNKLIKVDGILDATIDGGEKLISTNILFEPMKSEFYVDARDGSGNTFRALVLVTKKTLPNGEYTQFGGETGISFHYLNRLATPYLDYVATEGKLTLNYEPGANRYAATFDVQMQKLGDPGKPVQVTGSFSFREIKK